MKVIFITREGYQLSGARIRCYGFARQLNKFGINTEVFSFADSLGALYGPDEFRMGLIKKLHYNLIAFRRLIAENKQSVFFLQRLNYHALAPLLASLLHKNKVIFDCDDWNIREDPKYYFGIFPSSKMEYATRKLASGRVCIAASFFLRDYLRSFSKKVHYLPTGVDTDFFYPRQKQDKQNFIFSWTGTAFCPEMGENLMFILSCFSELAAKLDNIFLYTAGQGKYYEGFKEEAAKSKFSERIKISSWVSPEHIPEYLAEADCGLLPLVQETRFNKSKSPTKLFEYMAMAKPVVCSRIGEAKNIIADGETGLLAGSREEFIAKMKLLVLDSELTKNIGKRARQSAESRYSLNILGKELHAILGET